MNKQEFLDALARALSQLPREESEKSVDFYAEMIDDAVENGESEEEAVARLGNVEEIAKKIIDEIPLGRLVRENVRSRKWSASAIALIVLTSFVWLPFSVAALCVVFSLYLSIWVVIVSLFASCATVFLSGIAIALSAPFIAASGQLAKAALSFGAGLIGIGAGVIAFYLLVALTRLFVRITVLTMRGIKNIFIRRGGVQQ